MGKPWKSTFSDVVLAPVFSPDGKGRGGVKNNGQWTIAVDGIPWPETFDMIWDPVFSPDGRMCCQGIKRKRILYCVQWQDCNLGLPGLVATLF